MAIGCRGTGKFSAEIKKNIIVPNSLKVNLPSLQKWGCTPKSCAAF